MKLAYLILAHNNPEQLERLVKRLCDAYTDVYIHLDAKADILAYQNIGKVQGAYFVANRVKVAWGEYSVIQATLNGFKEILANGNNYSHINLLSGNDYPLRSNEEIRNFFVAHQGKTFMWYEPIFNDWTHGQTRMKKYYFGEYGFPGRYLLASLANKILPDRKLPGNLKAYGRAQWLSITPECAMYAIKYIEDKPALKRYFKMTWAVDEVFFQTILCNSPLRDTLANDFLRYVALQPDFRPVILTMADAAVLKSSGKFYARKFDSKVDSKIFDYLDGQK